MNAVVARRSPPWCQGLSSGVAQMVLRHNSIRAHCLAASGLDDVSRACSVAQRRSSFARSGSEFDVPRGTRTLIVKNATRQNCCQRSLGNAVRRNPPSRHLRCYPALIAFVWVLPLCSVALLFFAVKSLPLMALCVSVWMRVERKPVAPCRGEGGRKCPVSVDNADDRDRVKVRQGKPVALVV